MKQLSFLAVITILMFGCKTNPPTESAPPMQNVGKVFVDANVPDSKIYLNDTFTGKYTPDTLTLNQGDYSIKVVKEDVQKLVLIEDAQDRLLNLVQQKSLSETNLLCFLQY